MFVGVDLGTSSLKVLAVDADGAVVAESESPLGYDEPRPGWAETDPATWLRATRRCLDEVLAALPRHSTPQGIGVTGQMHGTVLLDGAERPVRPAVLWPDRRAADQAPCWAALSSGVRSRLGGPFSPGLTGPVLGWLAEHEPQALRAANRVVLPKDFVRGVLTATAPEALVTDPSDASGTLLWDVGAAAWSVEAAAAARVDPALLPDVVPADREAGSTRGVTVVAGAGDTPASLVALERTLGGWRAGDLVVNLGTGAQVIEPGCSPPGDDTPVGWHVYADGTGGFYAMVAVLNGGLALAWAQARLGIGWGDFAAAVQAEPAGAGGVVFRPFITEERGAMRTPEAASPGWVHDAGATTRQLARAAAEAQVSLVRRARELLGVTGDRVFLVGGGGREPWVRQLVADALGRPVTRLEIRSAAALGAAALAAGPGLRLPMAQETVEPVPDPALDAAYVRWADTCYPAAE